MPFIPSNPAALVLYIFFSVVIIAMKDMVKGSGVMYDGVPMFNEVVCMF